MKHPDVIISFLVGLILVLIYGHYKRKRQQKSANDQVEYPKLARFELHPIIDGKLGPDPVPMTEELVVGQDYAAIGITGQYVRWTVGKDEYGEYTINSGPSLMGVLQRGGEDGDDRKCWLVTGQINTRGLTKLMVERTTSEGSKEPHTE